MSFLTGYFLGQQSERHNRRMNELTTELWNNATRRWQQQQPSELDMAYYRIQQLEHELAQWKHCAQVKHEALIAAAQLLEANGIAIKPD